jgi:hypothetical protein
MNKKLLVSAFAAIAAVSVGSTALAADSSSSLYVGAAAGYGDTHWGNLNGGLNSVGLSGFSDTGFAGTVYAGFDFNQYLAVQTGYVYFPNAKASVLGNTATIKTYGVDVLGKITVPVTGNLGLFAEAGPGYLHSSGSASGTVVGSTGSINLGSTGNVNLVYGFGANYLFTPNLVADVSFTRFNGHAKLDNNYQPDADLYAVGVSYKFNV